MKASKVEEKSFLIIQDLQLELEDGEDMYALVFSGVVTWLNENL